MTNFIVTNKIGKVEGLKLFRSNGYKFSPKMSDLNNFYFIRIH